MPTPLPVIYPATPWYVPPESVEFLLSTPDFTDPDRYFDITDSEGLHEFLLVDSFTGMFDLGNDIMPIDRCVVNEFPTSGGPGRKVAYAY